MPTRLIQAFMIQMLFIFTLHSFAAVHATSSLEKTFVGTIKRLKKLKSKNKVSIVVVFQTYTELNPCSKHNTCSECLRNAECNWCSDPDFAYVDGTPLPRCNNDSFFTSKLCPEAKRVDPWRALTGSEDCSDCKHTCSGGICSEDKKVNFDI